MHLFVDISSHGFGHLAQVAPVLNALASMVPALHLTVRSGLPEARLRLRIRAPFTYCPGCSDFGYVMHDAVRIDHAATAAAYRAFHTDWAARVDEEARVLARVNPDAVLTDVAYLPLAGAAVAGIPALSMCSLNWADLFAHFYGDASWAAAIHRQMRAAYGGAAGFLRLTPAMPMDAFGNVRAIAPVAEPGHMRRRELCAAMGVAADSRIVLVAFGGFDKTLAAERWPATEGVHWLVPQGWQSRRPDMQALEASGLPFSDLLASVDAVLTKPGYGTFVEAACAGVPVLYLRRDDWPEQAALIDWLHGHARCAEIDEPALHSGDAVRALSRLWAAPRPPVPLPEGNREAARCILALAGYKGSIHE